jgi:hypothetical protein
MTGGQTVHQWARQGLPARQQLVGANLVFARFGLDGIELRKQRNGHGRVHVLGVQRDHKPSTAMRQAAHACSNAGLFKILVEPGVSVGLHVLAEFAVGVAPASHPLSDYQRIGANQAPSVLRPFCARQKRSGCRAQFPPFESRNLRNL